MAAMDIAGALGNVKTMLSGLTEWQAICSVDTAAKALEGIHEGGVEETTGNTLCPCIILDVNGFDTMWSPSRLHANLAIEIRTEVVAPSDKCTHQEQKVWALQQLGNLMAGIAGSVNGSGQIMIEGLNVTVAPGLIEPDENHGRTEWGFVLELVVRLI